MTKDVVKTNGGSQELALPIDNPFTKYGEATRQTAIIGKLLKFQRGDWSAGEQSEPVEEGSEFLCNMDQILAGWQRWSQNKPTDHVMGRIADGFQPPRRNELGDMDESLWEVDDDGKSRDPWQLSNLVLLQDADGEHYTFATSSRGGLNAVGALCIAYGKQMRQRPNEYPIIKIGTGSYMHSNRAFGRIKFPTFEIVGWKPKADFISPESGEADRGDEAEAAPAPTPAAKPAPVKVAPAVAAKATAKPVPKGKGKTRF